METKETIALCLFGALALATIAYMIHDNYRSYRQAQENYRKYKAFEEQLEVGQVYKTDYPIPTLDPFNEDEPSIFTITDIKTNKDGDVWVRVKEDNVKKEFSWEARDLYTWCKPYNIKKDGMD